MRRVLQTITAFLILSVTVFSQIQPPPARVENVTDDYFGTKITDPYRRLEDLKADETQQWMKAQAVYADAYLKNLPERARFLKRLDELSVRQPSVGQLKRFGDYFYYFRRAPNDDSGKIMRRGVNAPATAAQVLFDLDKMSKDAGKSLQIGVYLPSPDGKFVVYSVYAGGSEIGETRVIETATGRDAGVRITNGASPQDWLPDSKGFFYTRYENDPQTVARDEKKLVRLHLLGADVKDDRPIFGYGVDPEIKFPLVYSYTVTIPPGSRYAFGWANPGVTKNSEFYYAPVADLQKTQPLKWRKIASLDDNVVAGAISVEDDFTMALKGDSLYLISSKNAARGKVIRVDLNRPNVKAAETFYESPTEIVSSIRAGRDALYVQTLDAGAFRLRRVDYRTKKSQSITLPADGSAFDLNGDQTHDGIVFGTDSYVVPETYVRFDPRAGKLINTNLAAPPTIDASGYALKHAQATSADGTRVPLVIISKRDVKLDGANPTLLMGYGAYGLNFLEPAYQSRSLAWLERGGVLALAGARGGGERGEAWHQGGFQQTKPNTWKDFIACAEFLVANKYTSPQHLGIQGASAGGILISNAIVARPELFAAAVDQFGMNNMLRLEQMPNGADNTAEFGSVKTAAGFKSLLAMDGYQKIKNGVKYPAVLLTHGINDPRVEPWMSAKYAARMQSATTSGKPVLLRLDYDAGHGGTSRRQINEERANIYAFLFDQLK